jgi:hypothetical protein
MAGPGIFASGCDDCVIARPLFRIICPLVVQKPVSTELNSEAKLSVVRGFPDLLL